VDQAPAPGWNAHAGVTAALLAQSGFTGPETVLEGEHGFYRAFAGGVEPARLDELLASLGRVWELEQLTFKPYPCGSIAQPYMDCALRLRESRGVRADDIVGSDAGPPRDRCPVCGSRSRPSTRRRTAYAAKFSLPYLLAVILTRGRASLAEFEDDVVRDPQILSVASRVGYEVDATIDYPRQFVGHLRARLKDGRVVEEWQDHPRGGPDSPMSRGTSSRSSEATPAWSCPRTGCRRSSEASQGSTPSQSAEPDAITHPLRSHRMKTWSALVGLLALIASAVVPAAARTRASRPPRKRARSSGTPRWRCRRLRRSQAVRSRLPRYQGRGPPHRLSENPSARDAGACRPTSSWSTSSTPRTPATSCCSRKRSS
jgi:hypothetical protein